MFVLQLSEDEMQDGNLGYEMVKNSFREMVTELYIDNTSCINCSSTLSERDLTSAKQIVLVTSRRCPIDNVECYRLPFMSNMQWKNVILVAIDNQANM